ncbi:hypothetical protein Taro_011651 [Colocasia esculenta]|uniref:Uncharacterized protein n=1 Tax=Colocasia esculenta TaxID=4460 RepID=A0A843UBH3_COLES|nr:hypothetical protein [Colocasia esculenta]
MVVRTSTLSHFQSSRGWPGTPRTVRSSTRRRPANPVSHCLAPCGPGTTWRGQAWDRTTGCTPGGGDGAVGEDPVASSGFPFSVYITLGVRLLSSDRVRARRRRWGGRRGPRS